MIIRIDRWGAIIRMCKGVWGIYGGPRYLVFNSKRDKQLSLRNLKDISKVFKRK